MANNTTPDYQAPHFPSDEQLQAAALKNIKERYKLKGPNIINQLVDTIIELEKNRDEDDRYLRYGPKSKLDLITLLLKNQEVGKQRRKLLNKLKKGDVIQEDLIAYLKVKPHLTSTKNLQKNKRNALKDLVRKTNQWLVELHQGLEVVKIVSKTVGNKKVYRIDVHPNWLGFPV